MLHIDDGNVRVVHQKERDIAQHCLIRKDHQAVIAAGGALEGDHRRKSAEDQVIPALVAGKLGCKLREQCVIGPGFPMVVMGHLVFPAVLGKAVQQHPVRLNPVHRKLLIQLAIEVVIRIVDVKLIQGTQRGNTQPHAQLFIHQIAAFCREVIGGAVVDILLHAREELQIGIHHRNRTGHLCIDRIDITALIEQIDIFGQFLLLDGTGGRKQHHIGGMLLERGKVDDRLLVLGGDLVIRRLDILHQHGVPHQDSVNLSRTAEQPCVHRQLVQHRMPRHILTGGLLQLGGDFAVHQGPQGQCQTIGAAR